MATNFAIVDLYLARGPIRAELPLQGFSRVSDVFNNAPGDFIGTSMSVSAAPGNGGRGRTELVVRLRDVRLVRPIEEHPAHATPGARRDRLSARLVIDLDDWQVIGDAHPVDRVPWLDFAMAVRSRFISVSNARVRFLGRTDTMECEYLLVNGARISALYEVS